MIKTTRKANLRAQVGSYFKSPDCHLVPTVKPYSHLKGGSEEFLPCAKAEPVQHCSLSFPQCQGDTEVFLHRSTNASSIYRQVPLTLPPKVSGAPPGTRTQNPHLKRVVLTNQLSQRRKYQISLLPTPAATDRDLTQHPTPNASANLKRKNWARHRNYPIGLAPRHEINIKDQNCFFFVLNYL